MANIRTYPEMNAKISSLLRLAEDPMQVYAAQLIDEMKEERDELIKERDALGDQCTALYGALHKWVAVTNRLPEENDRYLTVMHRTVDPQYRAEFGDDYTEVRITRYYKGEWKVPRHIPEWINEVITDKVTYWMPLPELPDEYSPCCRGDV